MAYLTREQRKQLESVVGAARTVAEAGARAELRRLHVHEVEPAVYLTAEDRELRVRLRARAKQLGDVQDVTLGHGFERMVHACAYEQWHRMLFARFLAEHQLLMHPTGVAVSLQDCADLAADEGAADEWELAGRYAAAMLPQIFRPDDPLLAVRLADESRQKLEQLLARLDSAVFQGKDALGWVYQFWQAQKKKAINDSEVKIGADELPAVTQLFTEPYMVGFLLHNSLGAWWAGKVLAANPELAVEARDEVALREACAIPGVDWTYLRFVEEDGRWQPAAGTFEGWPKKAAQLKVLDPCCGSGHFLVGMLEILTAVRAAEEGLDPATACDAVLRDNLHGLEIDPRCTELAAFAVALAAWSLPGAEGVRQLPDLKIACSGLSLGVTATEFRLLAEGQPALADEVDQLYENFKDATLLGSLIQPRKAIGALFQAGAERAVVKLRELAEAERRGLDAGRRELAVTAWGAATAADMLASRYDVVVTNVPYLKKGKQDPRLADHCKAAYAIGAGNLAAAMLLRCVDFCRPGGTTAQVNINELLTLGGYASFRKELLNSKRLDAVARIGTGGFESITGEVVNVVLLVASKVAPRADHEVAIFDASDAENPATKADCLSTNLPRTIKQSDQLSNPDARILLDAQASGSLLADQAAFGKGSVTGDSPRLLASFWEAANILAPRVAWLDSPTSGPWSGRSMVLTCGLESPAMTSQLGYMIRGQSVWGKVGVAVNKMSQLEPFFYCGEVFDDNVGPIVPNDPADLPAFWAFVSAPEYRTSIRQIDQSLKVTAATLTKVPFDVVHWARVAAGKYPNGLPKPFSSDPTQWLFNGHPAGSDAPLQVAVARLCGYQWPRQTGSSFPDCPALEPDGLAALADDDGIVCLPAVLGERPAADRLLELLVTAYGGDWSAGTLPNLLASVGYGGHDLDAWLRDAFFEQHCKQFQHRPFIWQVWDGERDGFSALIHYHRLDHATLKKLTYSYLGDWIQRQEQQVREKRDGAEGRLAAAKVLQAELEKILEGEQPYDIFVRWKSLDNQPIGWQPDLDDGVRLNIRPFLKARDVGKRDAGILRWKPNIHWNKDRGKDVESAPWYKKFAGERVNDHHLTLAEKRAARGQV